MGLSFYGKEDLTGKLYIAAAVGVHAECSKFILYF
jgi:hypothetical protein